MENEADSNIAKNLLIRPKYHQSAIGVFLKCGLKYLFKYIEKIETPSVGRLTIGGSVDTAANYNFAHKVEHKEYLPEDDVLDAFSTEFEKRKPDTNWEGEDPNKQKDIGAECVRVHHAKIAPTINPKSVQEHFVLELDGDYDLGGTFDLTEQDDTLSDLKTAAPNTYKSLYPVENPTFRVLQPTMYDYAFRQLYGKAPKKFRYDVLVKPTKTIGVRVHQVEGVVTEDDHDWMFNAIDNVDKAIKAGVFLPAPEGAWWCSPKWCEYYGQCKGKKK